MTKPFLGSILVGSVNPDRLRSWYRSAFGSEQAEQGPLDVGEVAADLRKTDRYCGRERGAGPRNSHISCKRRRGNRRSS